MHYLIIYIIGFIISYLFIRFSTKFWTLGDRYLALIVSIFWLLVFCFYLLGSVIILCTVFIDLFYNKINDIYNKINNSDTKV